MLQFKYKENFHFKIGCYLWQQQNMIDFYKGDTTKILGCYR